MFFVTPFNVWHFWLNHKIVLSPSLSLFFCSLSLSLFLPFSGIIIYDFVFRCTSLNVIRDPYSTNRPGLVSIIPDVSPTPVRPPLAPLSQLQENAFPGEHCFCCTFHWILNHCLVFNTKTNGFLYLEIICNIWWAIFIDSGPRDSRSLPLNNRLSSRSVSQDSVYTILIRLPPDGGSGDERAPSIKMIQDDVPLALTLPPRRPLPSRDSDLGDVKLNLDG